MKHDPAELQAIAHPVDLIVSLLFVVCVLGWYFS